MALEERMVPQQVSSSAGRAAIIARLKNEMRPMQGEVPAFIFGDEEIFKLEMEKIFRKTWCFVAHETEIPSPGDYVTRSIGGWPVIVTRGEDNQIRILLNVCRHRGMKVCNSELGNASHFRCPYHGFTYTNKGNLVGVPYQREAFGENLNKDEMGLVEVRSGSYQGLIFGTFNEQAQPLEDFLGDMKWYMDIFFGRSEMEVVGPPQKWIANVDWKLAADNFASDSYHVLHTHRSAALIGEIPSGDYFKNGYQIALENGHGFGLTANHEKTRLIFPEDLMPEYEKNLNEDQMKVLRFMVNTHGNIAPHLSYLIVEYQIKGKNISFNTLKLWQPIGPGKMEGWSWFLVEKNAPDWYKDLSRQLYILNFGPSGLFEQDDLENWQNITGTNTPPINYKYLQGLNMKPIEDFPGPGHVLEGKWREESGRRFFQWWLDCILADE